jgi:Zn-dependent M28 family amino/carboxypeptidase
MPLGRRLVRVVLAATATLLVAAPSASAIDPVDTSALRDAVTVNGILRHERALQGIANMNGGTRVAGSPGYDASAAYVKGRLESAGYTVREQAFEFPYFEELAAPVLSRTAPTPKDYVADTDVATLEYSGTGDVTAPLVPVDLVLPPGPTANSNTSGCETADWAGFPRGAIALVQRGTCTFELKVANAQAAGAVGIILFNEGTPGAPDRNGLPAVTLGRPFTIPALGATFAVGNELAALAAAGPVEVHLSASTRSETRTTTNVLADTPGGDASETVVVGAHLDSVSEGPGINDNGSGTATHLAIAEAMDRLDIEPRRKIRFAFWGAEEQGLLGSEHYVTTLSSSALGDIYANVNSDMLGSPNYVRFVYDGDGSAGPPAGPPGSDVIESVFTRYFAGQGLATTPTDFDGRSDYGPFIAVGIPAGGLFSGAEGIKTAAEAAEYGGTEGEPYDPCYHQACDTMTNLNTRALRELGDGTAHAVGTLALSRSGLYEDSSLTSRSAKARASRSSKSRKKHRVRRLEFRGPLAIR